MSAIEPSQRTAAKVVGAFYLLMMVTGVFAEFYARGRLIVPADAGQTARNIMASERLFRLGTVSDLITFAGDVILVVALYVVRSDSETRRLRIQNLQQALEGQADHSASMWIPSPTFSPVRFFTTCCKAKSCARSAMADPWAC